MEVAAEVAAAQTVEALEEEEEEEVQVVQVVQEEMKWTIQAASRHPRNCASSAHTPACVRLQPTTRTAEEWFEWTPNFKGGASAR